jgi:hypothetical protein
MKPKRDKKKKTGKHIKGHKGHKTKRGHDLGTLIVNLQALLSITKSLEILLLFQYLSKNVCTHNTANIYYCSIFHDNKNEKKTSLFMLHWIHLCTRSSILHTYVRAQLWQLHTYVLCYICSYSKCTSTRNVYSSGLSGEFRLQLQLRARAGQALIACKLAGHSAVHVRRETQVQNHWFDLIFWSTLWFIAIYVISYFFIYI